MTIDFPGSLDYKQQLIPQENGIPFRNLGAKWARNFLNSDKMGVSGCVVVHPRVDLDLELNALLWILAPLIAVSFALLNHGNRMAIF